MRTKLEQRIKKLEGDVTTDEVADFIIKFVEPCGVVTGSYRLGDDGLVEIGNDDAQVSDDCTA